MENYRVKRTETILYVKDYARDELVALGVPPEVFTDGDLTADFADTVATDMDLLDALTEDTEPHGDVQGSDFCITMVRD